MQIVVYVGKTKTGHRVIATNLQETAEKIKEVIKSQHGFSDDSDIRELISVMFKVAISCECGLATSLENGVSVFKRGCCPGKLTVDGGILTATTEDGSLTLKLPS